MTSLLVALAGYPLTRNVRVVTAVPPGVVTEIRTSRWVPGPVRPPGTWTRIWVAVGAPTMTAAAAAKLTVTGALLKFWPFSVTSVPAEPAWGVNSAPTVTNAGAGTVWVARKSSSLTVAPWSVMTVILTGLLVLPAGTRPGGTWTTICRAVGVPTTLADTEPNCTTSPVTLKLSA